ENLILGRSFQTGKAQENAEQGAVSMDTTKQIAGEEKPKPAEEASHNQYVSSETIAASAFIVGIMCTLVIVLLFSGVMLAGGRNKSSFSYDEARSRKEVAEIESKT